MGDSMYWLPFVTNSLLAIEVVFINFCEPTLGC